MALTDDITDPRLAKALAHPLRLEILRHLGDRTASPSEIAAEIGAPLTNVSYHVRKLRALGLIKLVRKTPKRGVIEHYYSAKPRRAVTDDAWAATPAVVKEAIASSTAKRAATALLDAATTGGYDRADSHFSHYRWKVDEEGWAAIAKVFLKALRDAEAIEAEAQERIKDPGAKLVNASSIVSLSEISSGDAQPA